jgi:hypothetical protein
MVSHCSGEKEEGDGVLWQRWQFSAHNCTPDLADTCLLGAHEMRLAPRITINPREEIIDTILRFDFFIFGVLKLDGELNKI